MNLRTLIQQYRASPPRRREYLLAALLLGAGLTILPVCVYVAGALTLGGYEGASFWHFFARLYTSLFRGSLASWVMVLGPYGLLWVWRGLALWWRRSPDLARS